MARARKRDGNTIARVISMICTHIDHVVVLVQLARVKSLS